MVVRTEEGVTRGAGEKCPRCLCASDLGLKVTGVRPDLGEFARISERLETSIGGMMALGYVEGGPVFTDVS